MPAVITHYLFGEEVLKLTGFVPECPNIFIWGTQGPDFLFFSLPLGSEGTRLTRFGIKMHERDVEENMRFICDCCRTAGGLEKKVLVSYLYGYLAHFILDSCIHPYVYELQDQFNILLPKAQKSFLHKKIETNLDIIFLRRFREMDIRTFSISDKLIVTKELIPVCRLYSRMFHKQYGAGIGYEKILRSFQNMKMAYAALYSPRGGKRNAFSAAERLAGHRYPEIAALAHTVKPSREIDYTNVNRVFKGKDTGALAYTVYEHFNFACYRYCEAADLIARYLTDGSGDFSKITKGCNFKGNFTYT